MCIKMFKKRQTSQHSWLSKHVCNFQMYFYNLLGMLIDACHNNYILNFIILSSLLTTGIKQ